MGFDLDKWYLQKTQGEVIYKYKGGVFQYVIEEALDNIERSLNLSNDENKIRKKVYNVFVESIQNLFHHVDRPPDSGGAELADNFGVIILARERQLLYRISTGNFITVDKVGSIKDRIEQVNSLNEQEIRMLYREILGNEGFSQKGGGGLGILDIARRTSNKLEYNIYPFDDEYIFFELDVYI